MRVFTLILLCQLSVSGCQHQPAGSVQVAAPANEMAGRLEAALAMQEGTARHNSLVQVAELAAEKGDGDVVLRAISAVDEGTARNNLCATCASALASHGQTSVATDIAKQITNETQRSNVLAGIATGNQSE